MQPWAWLTAYVVGFGLLQVLLYRRFNQQSPKTTEGRAARASGGRTLEPETAESSPCQHCGTVNEAHRMVRYCRECTESLR